MIAQLNPLYVKTRPIRAFVRLISYALFEGRPLTTNGRWVNSIVFSHFALEKRLPQLKRVEKPVFIVGAGRSGTTLLGILLSMHKNVGYLNEPKALWHAIYDSEDVIGSYTGGVASYRLTATEASSKCIDTAHKLFGAYLRLIGAKRVVDKYPELVFRMPFVKEIFQDAKFIFLSRNGWDTAASIDKWSYKKRKIKRGETHDWWGKDGRKWKLLVDQIVVEDPDLMPVIDKVRSMTDHNQMAMVEWTVTMREGLRMFRRFTEDVFWLRYEDLTVDPKNKLNELLRFCDLPDDPVFMSYALSKIKPHKGHKRIDIPDVLRPVFDKVTYELGYERLMDPAATP
jgi:hypothetical protein